jgi:DNA-binding transcriptional LysR family regulator
LAAAHLHATQAAISQRIAALELDLGVRLLERNYHDVQLTQEGTFVLEKCEAIVLTYAETKRRATGGKALKSAVKIGISDVVSLSFLPQLYNALIHEYEVQTIEGNVDAPYKHYHALKDGQIDVAIGPSASQGEEVVNLDLCDFSMRWVASSRLALPDGPMSLSMLTQFPVVSYLRSSLPHRLIEQQLRSVDRNAFRLHSVSSLAGVIRLVIGGVGVSAVPVAVVRREIEDGLLQVVPVREPFPDVRIAVTHLHAPEDATPRLLVAALKDAVKAYCDDDGRRYVTPL